MTTSFASTDVESFTRLFLALFYTVVALFYTFRIVITKKMIKQEMVFPGARFSATWWNCMTFKFFRTLIWAVCVIRYITPETDRYLGLIPVMQQSYLILLGDLLLLIGFLTVVFMNMSFGDHWRSGIDPKGPYQLETNGLYRYSRNPMFCFVILAQFGFFLALPSIFSLICLVVGIFILVRQVHSEEAHLADHFQEEYRRYTQLVRRWL